MSVQIVEDGNDLIIIHGEYTKVVPKSDVRFSKRNEDQAVIVSDYNFDNHIYVNALPSEFTSPTGTADAIITQLRAWKDNVTAPDGGEGSTVATFSPAMDLAGGARVSVQTSFADLKHLHDKLPDFYDEDIIGTGASNWFAAKAGVKMDVLGGATDQVIRQTYQRYPYQAGKPNRITLTFNSFGGGTGIQKRVGYFDSNFVSPFQSNRDGIWIENVDGVISLVIGKDGVERKFNRDDWTDKLDGTGASGVSIDFLTDNIIAQIDFLWLGSGPVRLSFEYGDKIITAIVVDNNDSTATTPATDVYMNSPNKPVRYEIIGSSGASDSMVQVCTSVVSEGSENTLGIIRSANAFNTALSAASSGTRYAAMGLRLKSGYEDAFIDFLDLSIMNGGSQDFLWEVYLNPTVAGTFTYGNLPANANSALEYVLGDDTNTVTIPAGAQLVSSGYAPGSNQVAANVAKQLNSARKLGAAIDGTADEYVFVVTPLAAGATIYIATDYREFN